jgi:hypothetical protein
MLKMIIGAVLVIGGFALGMFFPEMPGRIFFTIGGGLLITWGFWEFKTE